MDYFVLFKGDLQQGHNVMVVVSSLALLLSVPEEDLYSFFKGEAVFFRNNLDLYTAKKYQEQFRKIGGRAFIGKADALNEISIDCISLQKIAVIRCKACEIDQVPATSCIHCNKEIDRIVEEKHERNSVERKKHKEFSPYTSDSKLEKEKFRRKSKNAFKITAVLFICYFVLNEYVVENIFISTALGYTLEPGYFFYILISVVIIYGCFFYLRLKGYHALFSLFGVFNVFGLGVIILLPNRNKKSKTSFFSFNNFMAFSMIAYSFYFAGYAYSRYSKLEGFLSKPIHIMTKISYSEVAMLNPEDVSILQQQEQEEFVKQYLSEGEDLIYEYKGNSEYIKQVSDRLFFILSRYSIWLELQRFVLLSNNLKLPKALQENTIKESIFDLLKPLLRLSIYNYTFFKKFQEWFTGLPKNTDKMTLGLSREIFYRISVFPDIDIPNKNYPIEINPFQLNRSQRKLIFESEHHNYFSEAKLSDDILFIRLKDNLPLALAGKTIIYGIWGVPGRSPWSSEKGSYQRVETVIRRIGGTLPVKFTGQNNFLSESFGDHFVDGTIAKYLKQVSPSWLRLFMEFILGDDV